MPPEDRPVLYGLAEEGVRNAEQNAGTIACSGVITRGATVHQALQDGETRRHYSAGRDIVERGDEAYATGIMFKFGVVQPTLLIFFLVHGSILRGAISRYRANPKGRIKNLNLLH